MNPRLAGVRATKPACAGWASIRTQPAKAGFVAPKGLRAADLSASRLHQALPLAGDDAPVLHHQPARGPLDDGLDVRLAVHDDEVGAAAGGEAVGGVAH